MKKYLTPEVKIKVITAAPLCVSGQEVDFGADELDQF